MYDFMICKLYLDKALKKIMSSQIHSFLSETNPLDGLNGETRKGLVSNNLI